MHTARAMDMRCFCPPDRLAPLCWISVSRPSCSLRYLSMHAMRAASSISASVRSLPYPMLNLTVPEKRTGLWVAYPIFERSASRSYSLTSTPSISTLPEVASNRRGMRLTREVLPEPV